MEEACYDKIKEERFDAFIRAMLNTGTKEPSEIELEELFTELKDSLEIR